MRGYNKAVCYTGHEIEDISILKMRLVCACQILSIIGSEASSGVVAVLL
jgi:hypothetical protein